MTRIEQIRILVAELGVLRSELVGDLPADVESRWRHLQAELEDQVREERRAQVAGAPQIRPKFGEMGGPSLTTLLLEEAARASSNSDDAWTDAYDTANEYLAVAITFARVAVGLQVSSRSTAVNLALEELNTRTLEQREAYGRAKGALNDLFARLEKGEL